MLNYQRVEYPAISSYYLLFTIGFQLYLAIKTSLRLHPRLCLHHFFEDNLSFLYIYQVWALVSRVQGAAFYIRISSNDHFRSPIAMACHGHVAPIPHFGILGQPPL